ncbi:MAG: peptidoglycan-binding protein, partial [Rhizobiaceae bacterium]|nr:peptidoglycan-binding protein [Rhizobiaceae bacterium]
MKTNRRLFLTGASAAAMATLATSAVAQDVIRDLLNSTKRGTWNNQFDARATTKGEVASYQPILGPETVSYVQTAIEQYRAIVAAGGWPMVPATKKLELGVVDKDVEVLRRRLMISGDLSQNAGMSPAFDTYVDSALKRFQARHGLPADGVTGRYTYAALNVSAPVRLGQLET